MSPFLEFFNFTMHHKENGFLLPHKTTFFKLQGATPDLYISGFGEKDKCVWPCDISCIVNSCSVCLCLLPEIGTVSCLSSRHMMTRVYSFSKYLLRISCILGMVPACGVQEGIKQSHSNNLSC